MKFHPLKQLSMNSRCESISSKNSPLSGRIAMKTKIVLFINLHVGFSS